MRKLIVGLMGLMAFLVVVGIVPASAADDSAAATGTIELKGGTAGLGVGFSWASGTLTYEGKTYPISAKGFNVGEVGGSSVDATGTVYNLTKLSDFDGSYSGFAAGAAVVAGGDVVSMVNKNGVHIELTSKTAG